MNVNAQTPQLFPDDFGINWEVVDWKKAAERGVHIPSQEEADASLQLGAKKFLELAEGALEAATVGRVTSRPVV